jgi:hypothetical protein
MSYSLKVLQACALTAGLLWMGQARAQEKKGDNVTVTGCLAKGDEAGEYSITGDDGKTYGLRSSKIKLAEHLGHKVTVAGAISKLENPKKEEAKTGKREIGDLRVTNLTMVSSSCP